MTLMTESFPSLTEKKRKIQRKKSNKVSIYKPPTELLQIIIIYI